MQSHRQTRGWWLALGLAVLMLGCRGEQPSQEDAEPAAENQSDNSSDLAARLARVDDDKTSADGMSSEEPATEDQAAPAEPAKPAAPRTVPAVVMTKALEATCLAKVGDAFPEADLVDLEGRAQSLRILWGPKLTVIVFWNADNRYAQQELQDLQLEIVEPYAAKGVQAVGIGVKEPADKLRGKLEKAGASFPQLLDADGAFFAKVATEKLPRTYLLDADGKILWFDLEYSTATRRNLLQAIQVALGEG